MMSSGIFSTYVAMPLRGVAFRGIPPAPNKFEPRASQNLPITQFCRHNYQQIASQRS